mmetsp:Transcript_30951/g.64910  ORF Transcript_30951/g.64910 Transcript_30951/m.64910 type:complete len:204 (+) Transcript_30951:1656-2267(+)
MLPRMQPSATASDTCDTAVEEKSMPRRSILVKAGPKSSPGSAPPPPKMATTNDPSPRKAIELQARISPTTALSYFAMCSPRCLRKRQGRRSATQKSSDPPSLNRRWDPLVTRSMCHTSAISDGGRLSGTTTSPPGACVKMVLQVHTPSSSSRPAYLTKSIADASRQSRESSPTSAPAFKSMMNVSCFRQSPTLKSKIWSSSSL